MSSPGILDALAAAMRAEEYAAAHHAAATVASLLCVDAYRPIVGAKRPLLAALVALLRGSGRGTRATKDALKALFGVALYPLNRAALVELGAVRALFALVMKDGRTGIVEDATAVVAQVAGCAESLGAFAGVSGVRILVDLVESGGAATGRARENAASALLNLVMAGGERAVAAVLAVGGAEEAVRGARGGRRGQPQGEGQGRFPAQGAGGGRRRRQAAAGAPVRRLPQRAGAVGPVLLVAGVGHHARRRVTCHVWLTMLPPA
jgi:hypothetical protein